MDNQGLHNKREWYEWLSARLDAYIDKELPADELQVAEKLLEEFVDLKAKVNERLALSNGLHQYAEKITAETAGIDLTAKIIAQCETNPAHRIIEKVRGNLLDYTRIEERFGNFWRVTFASLASAAATAAVIFLFIVPKMNLQEQSAPASVRVQRADQAGHEKYFFTASTTAQPYGITEQDEFLLTENADKAAFYNLMPPSNPVKESDSAVVIIMRAPKIMAAQKEIGGFPAIERGKGNKVEIEELSVDDGSALVIPGGKENVTIIFVKPKSPGIAPVVEPTEKNKKEIDL